MLQANEGQTYEPEVRKFNEYFQKNRDMNPLRSELFSMRPKEGEQTSHWIERQSKSDSRKYLENST